MANGNPFYVDPMAGRAQGLQALGGQMQGLAQYRDQQAQQQAQQDRQSAGIEAMRAAQGDPSKLADVMLEYPEYADIAQKTFAFTNDQTRPIVEQTYAQVLADPANAQQYLTQGIEQVRGAGGKPTNMVRDLQSFQNNPEAALKGVELGVAAVAPQVYKAYDARKKEQRGSDVPSGTQEFNDLLQKATSEDEMVRKAARVKLGLDPRATGSAALTITELGNAPDVAQTEEQLAAGKEAGKLSSQLRLQPKVKNAVETASRAAAKMADDAIKADSNQATFDVYDVGMSGVAEALGDTSTGPFVGRLPAITSEQQIAEGAIAAMAPVLKQMFRAAGEGAFTDYDQKLLLDMMPTRKDTPDAAQAKLKNIDAIVRSKLGIADPNQQPAQAEAPAPAAQGGDFSNLWGG